MHRRNDVLGISERRWARITGIAVGVLQRAKSGDALLA
jgi:hypothetical protein